LEPAGVLRAILDCWADPAVGPEQTTGAVLMHLARLWTETHWWKTLTRAAIQVSLVGGNTVDIAKIHSVSHRLDAWMGAGSEGACTAGELGGAGARGQHEFVYGAMFASDNRHADWMRLTVRQAWLAVDPGQLSFVQAEIDGWTRSVPELARLL